MKKGRKQWLRISTRMMSGALTLLGFAACDSDSPEADEYGTPYATYEIKGKVTDEDQKEITGARIIVKALEYNSKNVAQYAQPDTLKVGTDGSYDFKTKGFPDISYRVVCEDPAAVYNADSVDVQMDPKNGGDGWYAGSDSKEVNFKLKKK